MRKPNRWRLINKCDAMQYLHHEDNQKLADQLNVTTQTIRSWKAHAIPNPRYQFALLNIIRPPKPDNISLRLRTFVNVHKCSNDDLAILLGLTINTINQYINETKNPDRETLKLINDLMCTPRPFEDFYLYTSDWAN